MAGYAVLQSSGSIDHFFVAGQFSRCNVGPALMGHIYQVAAQRNISKLSAHVSLAAELFFASTVFLWCIANL
ncbi:MAG: hypothetical protein GX043_12055 [Desulfovibrionales bacterium]|nr:hypothetical protein [Desulfovibrionales bacterium]